MKTLNINKGFLVLVFIAFYFNSIAQEWKVPENDNKITSSIAFSKATARDGKDLFNAKCKSCHGAVGTDSSLPLNPKPGDPAGEKFSKQTDGALFYKITNGRGAMPAFASQLSEEERWKIISYIRTFHKDYQPTNTNDVVENTESFSGKNIQISTDFNEETKEVTVHLQGEQNGEVVAANDVRVGFYVKRNFGKLLIGKIVSTDAKGVAKMNFPSDLPGDSLGNYKIIVKLVDDDLYGNVESEKIKSWGQTFVYESPLSHRAMWGNRGNAPLWLLFSYFGIVGAVWITIFWVVFQMMKLKNAK
jgi:mono/diheme cytochrome c family protein/ribosomal protein L35AE/L33A